MLLYVKSRVKLACKPVTSEHSSSVPPPHLNSLAVVSPATPLLKINLVLLGDHAG